MKLWSENQFDLLVQEAVRCDESWRSSRHKWDTDNKHIIRVFSRLM